MLQRKGSKRKEPTKAFLEDILRTETIPEMRTLIPSQPLKLSTSPVLETRRSRSTPVTRMTATWRLRRGRGYRRRRELILIQIPAGRDPNHQTAASLGPPRTAGAGLGR